MPTIPITIHNKIASPADGSSIVCGNSDYALTFTFDSEWDDYPVKTMHAAWIQNGEKMHCDIEFEGTTCYLPPIYNAISVLVGVYAGDIRTSTPAYILCLPCITDNAVLHPDPSPDIYDQLLEYLAGMHGGGTVHGAATYRVNGVVSGSVHGTAEPLEV